MGEGVPLPGAPEDLSLELRIKADCLFGDDLETMEDHGDWLDIYEKDWGELQDLFEGLNALTDMF